MIQSFREAENVFDAVTGMLMRGVRRSRTLTELAQSLQFEFEHPPDGPVILVHQMARVGSVAVLHALLKTFPRANVYHTHYLNPDSIQSYHERFNALFLRTRQAGLHREFLAARTLAGRLRGPVHTPWKVITLVRDPVARTVSAFFRHFALNHPELETGFEADPANVDRLIELFLEPDERERSVTLEWFEREVQDVFGLDVYATPFPDATGHATYTGEKCEMLLIRTEDLDRVGPGAIGAFLNVQLPPIERENRSAEEPYAESLARFRERIRMPERYLNEMYRSRLARHFHTEAEIATFRAKWNTD